MEDVDANRVLQAQMELPELLEMGGDRLLLEWMESQEHMDVLELLEFGGDRSLLSLYSWSVRLGARSLEDRIARASALGSTPQRTALQPSAYSVRYCCVQRVALAYALRCAVNAVRTGGVQQHAPQIDSAALRALARVLHNILPIGEHAAA